MRRRALMIAAAVLWFAGTGALAAGVLYVASENARLKAQAKASSETLLVVPPGTQVEVLEEEGRWYKVRLPSGKEGWIYRGRLSEEPPVEEKEAGGLGSLLAGASAKRMTADEAGTARSIRGLSKETEQYANMRGTPAGCRRALDELLSMKISPKEVEAFLREGRIGEYAP